MITALYTSLALCHSRQFMERLPWEEHAAMNEYYHAQYLYEQRHRGDTPPELETEAVRTIIPVSPTQQSPENRPESTDDRLRRIEDSIAKLCESRHK